MARIAIDLNVRIGADLTYSGFEDIEGATAAGLPMGTPVEVHEAESGACGPGVVAGRDFDRELIYVRVEWGQLRVAAGEDAADAAAAREARASIAAGEAVIPWEQVKAEAEL